MFKHYFMEFFNWGYTFSILIFFVIVGGFFIHTQQLNAFNQQAVEVVQRSGGVTGDAQKTLEQVSSKSYMNMFYVTGDSEQTGYGDTVNYQIHSRIPFTKEKAISATSQYSTVSQIRKDSQSYTN